MDHNLLLTLLMENEYVSGEAISRRLGVTRAAVWKAIENLRKQGYEIESAKKRGYRLVPPEDAVWPSCIRKLLSTRWTGSHIEYHSVIDSTNFRARALGLEDAPHGTLIIADEQTAGRGRMARSWTAEPGSSLLMSLLLRPQALAPMNATGIVLIAALAACMACRDEGADVKIKWPNDLVAGGKKICGMLLDMNADMDRVHYAVVGVGVNISAYPWADDLRHASCLMEACGHEVSRAKVAARFLTCFETLYDRWSAEGIASLLPDYRKLSITLGSRVRVISLTGTFEAVAMDILEDGALLVQTDTGERVPVHAGDVSVRGVMDYV